MTRHSKIIERIHIAVRYTDPQATLGALLARLALSPEQLEATAR
jgi:hypothetical protein